MILRNPPEDPTKWKWGFAYLPVRMDNGTLIFWQKYRWRRVDVGHLWAEIRPQRHLTEEQDW